MTFRILLILLLRSTIMNGQLNMYNTDRTLEQSPQYYDCLDYHVVRKELVYGDLYDVVDERIPYCFRPSTENEMLLEGSVHPLSKQLSFEELRRANISARQLLAWSSTVEVFERYQRYLNEPNSVSNDYFYNCTDPWFGSRCQYSFPFGGRISFNKIVEEEFRRRTPYTKSSDIIVHKIQMPCYVLLKCQRNGESWCLDWREICNGVIDCFYESLDEEYCFAMEINECRYDEFRCHNGLCIASDMWEDGEGDADCLDRSDEKLDAFYLTSCFQDPTFRCEEHSCRTYEGSFPCGDGQCVAKFAECHNGRHALLIDAMIAKGNLTNECWIATVCLTRFVQQINGSLCDILLTDDSIIELLQQCDSFFQFPVIPVHSNHIRFVYEDVHLKMNMDDILFPDYICYDQQLCDFIKPELVRENLTCINASKAILDWIDIANPWPPIMSEVEADFRPCLVSHFILQNKLKNQSDHSSLYNCQNSSKFISKHRIMDRQNDCFREDDEIDQNSCQLNHRHRVRCRNINKCWSPVYKAAVCSVNGEAAKIPFEHVCDGIEEYIYYDTDGTNYTDEFGCEDWLCDNIYARCDGYWACKDGRDENECTYTKCPLRTQACIDPSNYTLICLPADRVNNGIDDCLGASDEQHECRISHPTTEVPLRFRCWMDDTCLLSSQLCNYEIDCLNGDDENFCKIPSFTCNKTSMYNRSEIEEVLCGISEQEKRKIQYFSIHTSSNYPSLKNSIGDEISYWPTVPEYSIVKINETLSEENVWPWKCNRGVSLRISNGNDTSNVECLCPPSYYGYECQYQNQRVSLTLLLSSINRHATYTVIIMLINDNRQEIEAYDQFIYIVKESCRTKFNRYLLFSTRPKDLAHNYHLRIDAFETNSITYIGSWYFPISFLFLPVNRLGLSLILSNYSLQISSNCSITCKHGHCVKYLNEEKYLCRCKPKWTGIQCDLLIHRQPCSPDSLYLGSTRNQSICICPLHKFGSQCLFSSACPDNICQNNGECIPAISITRESSYTCICPDQFFGRHCQYRKARLDVTLENTDIPPYLLAYFFTLSNQSQPTHVAALRKLTLFQHIVTFHTATLFHMVVIQSKNKYYLVVLQQTPKTHISTLIQPSQECVSTEQLLNSTVLNMIQYRRIIFFHRLCRTHAHLTCLIDSAYLCLCTNDRHANCLEFNHTKNLQCSLSNHCENEAQCLQDHPTCPSSRICVCPKCFFGDKCQFYAKGLGSTLDEILGYEFKHKTKLFDQPATVIVSAILTMLICIIGIINGILSIMIFLRKTPPDVGTGAYFLSSSINSLIITILFTIKFWLLYVSHQYVFGQNGLSTILLINCRLIEPLIKLTLSADNWLNACIAIERLVSIGQGLNFDKEKSIQFAKYINPLVFIIMGVSYLPQFLHLHVYADKIEERNWCVVTYSSFIQIYGSIWIIFQYVVPLSLNIIAAVGIIILSAIRRSAADSTNSFWYHFKNKIEHYTPLLISITILTTLTLPHLIISFILDCSKSSHLLWFYLASYFLSFTPAAFIFFIFIMPSPLYKKEFQQMKADYRRRLVVFKSKLF